MRDRFYFDEIYGFVIKMTHEAVSTLAGGIDRWVIGGLFVKGIHGSTEFAGRALRLAQTGNIQTHAFLLVAGLALVLFLILH
jgi:NADH:ubiquinone oxidoreductase subunit 5 (subunit L)/multisubunit Na+/H+ antiporter MnhA subunit